MDKEKAAWIEGNKAANRILLSTIKQAREELSPHQFLIWLDGFLGCDYAKPKK